MTSQTQPLRVKKNLKKVKKMKRMLCKLSYKEFFGYPVDGFRHVVKFVYLLYLSEYVIYIEEASPII